MPRYIDAEKLDSQLKNKKPPYDMNSKAKEGFKAALLSVRSMIQSTDNIDVQEVRHGKWTTKRTMRHDGEIYCSLCEYEPDAKYKHCPHCGARMDGDEK